MCTLTDEMNKYFFYNVLGKYSFTEFSLLAQVAKYSNKFIRASKIMRFGRVAEAYMRQSGHNLRSSLASLDDE